MAVGLVDTFSLIQFCVNSGSQYGEIVVASAAGNFSDIGPKVLLEPITGLDTSYKFIMAVKGFERRKRIATLASFLAASGSSAVTTDPATNAALGGTIAAKIAFMKAALETRGGSQQLLEYVLTPSLKNYLMKNYSITVNPVVSPLLSPAQIKTTAFIGFTILGSLYLFQRAERKRSQNYEVIIDVTASPCD